MLACRGGKRCLSSHVGASVAFRRTSRTSMRLWSSLAPHRAIVSVRVSSAVVTRRRRQPNKLDEQDLASRRRSRLCRALGGEAVGH